MVNYVVVAHLVPQDTQLAEWLYVAGQAFEERQSIVYSADDAKRLVADGLPGSKVIVWGPQRWAADILAWLGVPAESRQFPHPLPRAYSYYLYPDVLPFQTHNAVAADHHPAGTHAFSSPQ